MSTPKDPFFRFVAGCAVIAAVVVALVVAIALLVGWQLARDEAPGRETESFLVGDETRYWRLELKADDAGLLAFVARLEEINDATRRKVFQGTIFESIPIPRRQPHLDELAPMTLEVSLADDGWAARGTLSHGMLRLRAGMKFMRWMLTRDAAKGDTVDIDGVTVTRFHDGNAAFSFATVGNRVLASSDADRMRVALQSKTTVGSAEKQKTLFALHRSVALPGEDAWAFWSVSPASAGAAASFDLNDRDELAFKMVVAGTPSAIEGGAFQGTPEQCLAVVAAFLPGMPVDAVELEAANARRLEHGGFEFSGRIAGVSGRVSALVMKAKAGRLLKSPSAIPTPPSLPPQSGPRSETPAGSPREGIPTPPH